MDAYKVIGKPVVRKDVLAKVTGAQEYIADMDLPKQLHAAVYRSPLPHARILKIDTSRARAYPGVRAVVTGEDAPYYYGRFFKDQTFLALDRVRYMGEPVAAVAADTREIAWEAARLITAEYEELPLVDDVLEAAKPGSPLVHEDWFAYKKQGAAYPVKGTNICDHTKLRKGNIDEGFAQADVVVENEYWNSMTSHAPIEPHGATVQVDPTGKVTIWSATQSPFYIREEIAACLGLPEHMVRVIVPQVGGGFGGKLELRAEPIALALAMKTNGRPVKLTFSRGEDFYGGVVRAPVLIRAKTGAKKDGTITAFQGELFWDTGAYSTTGPRVCSKATIILPGPYRIPNLKVDGYTVCTNKQLGTAYRGFGVSEAAYVHEAQMDALAEALKMDPLELRMKNILLEGDLGPTGEVFTSVGVRECLEKSAMGVGWGKGPVSWVTPEGKLRGRGLGTFLKFTGTPSFSSATLKMNLDGTVTLAQGGTELGQGMTTVMPQMIAEELGIPVERINMVMVDTENVPPDKTTTSSRLTFHMGKAVLLAVKDLQEKLKVLAADVWGVDPQAVTVGPGVIEGPGPDGTPGGRRVLMGEIKASGLLKKGPPLIGTGSFETSDIWDQPDPETNQSKKLSIMWFMGANGAEVEVDPESGQVKVIKVSAGNDVGKVINPLGCVQQIEGGIIMGIGNTLLEEMIYRDGKLMNGNMVDFKVPTTMDADVDMEIHLVETAHPDGPFGAKGVGEPAMCSVQAAVASAVAHAIGAPVTSIPVKPEAVLAALKTRKPGGKG